MYVCVRVHGFGKILIFGFRNCKLRVYLTFLKGGVDSSMFFPYLMMINQLYNFPQSFCLLTNISLAIKIVIITAIATILIMITFIPIIIIRPPVVQI